jgi:hypothetical protein
VIGLILSTGAYWVLALLPVAWALGLLMLGLAFAMVPSAGAFNHKTLSVFLFDAG